VDVAGRALDELVSAPAQSLTGELFDVTFDPKALPLDDDAQLQAPGACMRCADGGIFRRGGRHTATTADGGEKRVDQLHVRRDRPNSSARFASTASRAGPTGKLFAIRPSRCPPWRRLSSTACRFP